MSEKIKYNQYMLTTTDNPYSPFDEFTSWYMYDCEKGYNTCGYLARIADIPEGASEKEEVEEIERAIDEIINYDFTNLYVKVAKDSDNLKELLAKHASKAN